MLIPAPNQTLYCYDATIGASWNWNAGVQMMLSWSTSLDMAYVGSHNCNSVAFGSVGTPTGGIILDRNAPDPGTAYLPQFQDATLAANAVPGATALATALRRPYRGLGKVVAAAANGWPLSGVSATGNGLQYDATGAQAMRSLQAQLRFTF